jgi:hypothetical protein
MWYGREQEDRPTFTQSHHHHRLLEALNSLRPLHETIWQPDFRRRERFLQVHPQPCRDVAHERWTILN